MLINSLFTSIIKNFKFSYGINIKQQIILVSSSSLHLKYICNIATQTSVRHF